MKDSLKPICLTLYLLVTVPACSLCLAAEPASGLIPEPTAGAPSHATRSDPEILVLDATEVGRGIITSNMDIPVRPGPFTFVFPKWLPGYHSPDNPIGTVSQIVVSANGKEIAWHRDRVDMYAFHVDVPEGVSHIHVRFTALVNSPKALPMSTPNLAIVEWNRELFYQNNTDSHDVYFKASIILPKGWGYGTAMPDPRQHGDRIDFAMVPLNVLVDSPLDCGRYYKHVELWHKGNSRVTLDMFGDRPQDLDVPDSLIAKYKRVVPEALALYGARHWHNYHFLLEMSDKIPLDGLEHHQSSDNRGPDDFMTNPQERLAQGDLLTHEFSHSWNGKYRRPADLATLNFQIPEQTDLLWVYEGLNQYVGDLLSFRTGIRKPDDYAQYVATLYSDVANIPGRKTTPLIDTTTAAPYLYDEDGEYPNIRRSVDFYSEGELVWLDVDTIIRKKSHGRKSIADFLHLYAGRHNTGPIVKTYTRADIEKLLNEVVPYDWHALFEKYVYKIAELPASEEFERAGWKFEYNAKPNEFSKALEKTDHTVDQWLTYGLSIDKDNKIKDVREGSPAWNAGMAPGGVIRAVDGQTFKPELLDYMLKQAMHSKAPTVFLVESDGWYHSFDVDYQGGPRYPHLVRIPGKPDMFARMFAAHARQKNSGN